MLLTWSSLAVLSSVLLAPVASAVEIKEIGRTAVTRDTKWAPLEWIGPVVAGGPNITLTGPIESIYDQILVLNPEYSIEDHVSEAKVLTKRGISDWPPDCNAFHNARLDATNDGVKYLYRVGGTLHLPPGIGLCGRVSCSYNSGIFICHDRNEDLYVPTSWVADYAGGIRDACQQNTSPVYVKGQLFDINRSWMNVIVGGVCYWPDGNPIWDCC